MFTDIFTDDAFGLVAMTAAINNVDHIPGRAGELAFVGVAEGVTTTSVAIESIAGNLALIPTTPRGAPAPKNKADKANLRVVGIPQVKLEDAVGAHEVQGVRAFGTTDQFAGVQDVINRRLATMANKHDLTLENLRLGALRGVIKDSDGSVIENLFTLFGVTNDNSAYGGTTTDAAPKIFGYDLSSPSDDSDTIRLLNQQVIRWMRQNAKLILPGGYKVHAFCGDAFFDALIEREDVKAVYQNTAEQQVRLGKTYAYGTFEFGDIVFENYQGTDDGSTVTVASNEAMVFLTGVPGLYAEYMAPADFLETVNTPGLPRYAKIAADDRFNRFVELHTQQNPLPICLRPKTLVKLVMSA